MASLERGKVDETGCGGGPGAAGTGIVRPAQCQGLGRRPHLAELEDLTRAVRGLVRLVAYVLEVEVPPGETPEVQLEIRERLHTIVQESIHERGR